MDFKTIVFIIASVFICFLLLKEWKRNDKSRLYARLIASIAAVIALVLLILPLKYSVNHQYANQQIILLTAGFNKDSIPKGKKLFTGDSSVIKENPTLKLDFIPDLTYHLVNHKEIKQIEVYGYGLKSSELTKLKGYLFKFHPASYPYGFQSVSWSPQIAASQVFKVQGTFQNNDNKQIKLFLSGLGTALDSVSVAPKSTITFSFSTTPKQNGYSVYQLLALDGEDTLSREEIPFEVIVKSPIKVLLLASAPDFEFKFLKNWLYDSQYPVVLRTRISKDKFGLDFLNYKALSVDKVNQQLLQQFDLLIADDAELAVLSDVEKSALEEQIAQGMGLIIRINENKLSSIFSNKFSMANASAEADKSDVLKLQNIAKLLHPISVNQSLYFNQNTGNQPLVANRGGKILVNSILYGTGKIVSSTISTTHQWVLMGFGDDYSAYWSEIIGKSANKSNPQIRYQTEPNFPTPNSLTHIRVEINTDEELNQLEVDNLELSPKQNKYLPYLWEATFFPIHKGWKKVKINNQVLSSFYVYETDCWLSVKNVETIKANLQYAKNQSLNPTELLTKSEKEEKEISKWWFFFLFLMSAGYLWAEARLN